MLPDPLRPAVVHLPMALAVLIPALALLGAWLIHKSLLPARSWILIVFLQMLLVGSGWLALETGEDEEDRVERVVSEDLIEAHEEAAERFLLLGGIGLLVSGAGLLSGQRGSIGRVAGTVATMVVLAAGVSVGHLGGELVYEHGAANAYLDDSVAMNFAPGTRHSDDDDDRLGLEGEQSCSTFLRGGPVGHGHLQSINPFQHASASNRRLSGYARLTTYQIRSDWFERRRVSIYARRGWTLPQGRSHFP